MTSGSGRVRQAVNRGLKNDVWHLPVRRSPDGRLAIADVAGAARVRAYYDVHPSAESTLTLDSAHKNALGDPMPVIRHALDGPTTGALIATSHHISGVFTRLARQQNGLILSKSGSSYLDHPAGGCRMGTDPASSVCDSYGRTHDHDNLFVVGSPTVPTGGCTNGTLTFVALTLRSAGEVVEGD